MKIVELVKNDIVDFGSVPPAYFLLGLLSAFENRFQAMADRMIGEISWKQFFAIICINMCKEAPTINDLSEVLGSSHQNVKQILLKLESKGFIEFKSDKKDKRKQRIILTKKCMDFCSRNDDIGKNVMEKMFAGIPDKDIKKTIEIIMKIESNMKEG
ncbi:MAG: MarR family transcriptional regulator [Saccharofermentans sp.]|nr:MarR family transcriptional regulator [Saccharofermentans sp.]